MVKTRLRHILNLTHTILLVIEEEGEGSGLRGLEQRLGDLGMLTGIVAGWAITVGNALHLADRLDVFIERTLTSFFPFDQSIGRAAITPYARGPECVKHDPSPFGSK